MTIQNSELDFFQIKSELKNYLEKQSEFQDYDFDASGLSSILDVLAHNTHINGLTANMAINESFLSSAQLRSSVVSHAETLGYSPKSQASATAVVNITVSGQPNNLGTLTLPKHTIFNSTINESPYTFINTEECIATHDSITDTYVLRTLSGSENIQLKQGEVKTKSFIVGDTSDNSVYVIPDSRIDITTMTVKVFDNFNTTTFQVYNNINDVSTITDESRVYIVRETSNGYYEMFFSDGNVLGKAPSVNNLIQVEYISSSGADANGGLIFTSTENINTDISITPVTVSASAGGADRETINSIKLNAPRSYTAQNRLVTANDYTAMISSNYGSYLKDVATWGGNDNVPPKYGTTFVSLVFLDNTSDIVKTQVKSLIESQLTSNLSIMSIETEFVDPLETYLEIQTSFNVDPIKNLTTLEALQSQVNSFVSTYVSTNLGTFGAIFRRSNLLSEIDNLSTAILNSKMDVKIQQRIEELPKDENGNDIEMKNNYVLNFPCSLATPDKDEHTVVTSAFKGKVTTSGQEENLQIKNKLGSNILQLLDMDNVVKVSNIGNYDASKGQVSINALILSTPDSSQNFKPIKVSGTPANQSTINPLRNYVVKLDEEISIASGSIDTGSTKVLL